jgi:hypothetical protein
MWEVLDEGVDQRAGGDNVKTATTWQWRDAELAMEYWSSTLAARLSRAQQEEVDAVGARLSRNDEN